ncbi:MAG: hypothetical protein DRQ02_00240 [Candidatus Latescibacterota bacterium]|nr:MAG: hypothetical protein DRQ02_00240 [Candidatus Latescibacterota bacterium]
MEKKDRSKSLCLRGKSCPALFYRGSAYWPIISFFLNRSATHISLANHLRAFKILLGFAPFKKVTFCPFCSTQVLHSFVQEIEKHFASGVREGPRASR